MQGELEAHNLLITDTLPASTSYLYSYASFPCNGCWYIQPAILGNQLVWSVNSLSGGNTGSINLTIQLDSMIPDGTPIANTVEVSTSDTEIDYANNTAVLIQPASYLPDLSVWSWTSGSQTPGNAYHYGIGVSNYGEATAHDVVVSETLPVSTSLLHYTAYSYAPGYRPITTTPEIDGGSVLWRIGDLPAAGTAYIYAYVKLDDEVPPGINLRNSVEVATPDPEPRYDNNRSSSTSTVNAPSVDLSVGQWLSEYNSTPGGFMSYNISFNNYGTGPARDVVISNVLPPNSTLVWWNGSMANPYGIALEEMITPTLSNNRLVWNLGTLYGSYNSGNIYLTIRLDDYLPVGKRVTNTVQISTSDAETYYTNNNALFDIVVSAPRVDLYVNKLLNSGNPGPGSTLNYGISFGNSGESAAQDVVVIDTLPVSSTSVMWKGYTYDNPRFSQLHGLITPTVSGDRLTWHIGSMAPGSYGYINHWIKLDADIPVGTIFTNTAQVATSDAESNYANNVKIDSRATISPTVDLVLSKSMISSQPGSGEILNYRIFFQNLGSTAAGDVVVTDTLPLSTSLVSWSGSTYNPGFADLDQIITPTVDGNQIRWYIGSLATSSYGYIYPSVKLDGDVPPGSLVTNTARVSTSDAETNYANNTGTDVRTVVGPNVDMYVAKSVSGGRAAAGNGLNYQIYYQNKGTAAAYDVVLSDTLPVSSSMERWSGWAYNPDYVSLGETITTTVDGNQLRWYLGTVAASGYGYIYPFVRLDENLRPGDIITNVAEVGTSSGDANHANNKSAVTRTVVTPTVDVSVKKWLYAGLTAAGNVLDYEIYFENRGETPVHDVTVTDTLPISSSQVSWYGYLYNPDELRLDQAITPAVDGGKVRWYLGTMAASSYGFIFPRIRLDNDVPGGSTIPNRAEISIAEVESSYTNNASLDIRTAVTPTRDLRVDKWLNGGSVEPGSLITFAISYVNLGNSPAADVKLTDTLPVSLTYVSAAGPVAPLVTGNQIVWSLGTVAAQYEQGYTGYLYLAARITDTLQPGMIMTNTAAIASSQSEVSYDNNTTRATVVLPLPEQATPTPTPSQMATATATATPIPSATATATPTTTPGSSARPVSMYFQPSVSSVAPGKVVTLEVWVDAGDRTLAAIDAYFDYDKNYFEIVDGSGNPISSTAFISDTTMPQVNFNHADNDGGRATFSAGMAMGSSGATGNFRYASVRFRGKAPTSPSGTILRLHYASADPTDPRNTLIVDLMGNKIASDLHEATLYVASASLLGKVGLQARGNAPSDRWVIPLTVTLHTPGVITPSMQFHPSTDPSGWFTVTGIISGAYDVRVKKAYSLSNKRSSANLVTCDLTGQGTPCQALNMGMLLEGDANGDGHVNSLDYASLASSYFKWRGQPGFDERVDFNEDGRINSSDYAPLAFNYFKMSDAQP